MLLRNRLPALDQAPTARTGLLPIGEGAVAMLRWLGANRVDYVLVGPVARAVRDGEGAHGPVSIVPAPYGRNLDRLARALWSARARLRLDGARTDGADGTVPVKVGAEGLIRPDRWTLRCGVHDLDIEGRPAGVPRYQELLYEASRTEVAPGVFVEVASVADIEHYEHVRRTGVPPEIRVTRAVRTPSRTD
jgi:hypothetical protein